MEFISVQQIVTRDKNGGPRIVIPPNSRFDTEDYPGITQREWNAMLNGTPQVVRTPDDPAFVRPKEPVAAEPAAMPSPKATEASDATAKSEAGDDDDDDDPPPPKTSGRGRRRAKPDDDDDDI